MRSNGFVLGIGVVALVAACSASGSGGGDPYGTAAAAGSSASGGSAGSAGSATGGVGGGLMDAGGGTGGIDTDGGAQTGCQFVDILFLIDNSPSMHDPQDKLATQWSSFVDSMYSKLPPNIDLHVALTTTSFFTGNCSESTINCKTGQTPQEVSDHFIPPATSSTGENGGQGRLFEHGGQHFFAANTSDANHQPFKDWFSAAAVEAGETGCSYEFSSAGAAYTTNPANATANSGFFRDANGVLLLVFLTDEPDKSFEGTQKYHDMLAGVKSTCGGDDCIITAGLIDPCVQANNDPVWQLMNSFGEPPVAVGDIDGTAADYSAVVGDALASVVKQTCDSIVIVR